MNLRCLSMPLPLLRRRVRYRVSITELYPDGLLLDVITMNRYQNDFNALKDSSPINNSLAENISSINHQYFINFFVPISDAETLHEQYIALLQSSATKLGKRTIRTSRTAL